MAVAFGATLGTGAAVDRGPANGPLSISTTATVPSAGLIVALVGVFNAGSETMSMSGGSLTWTQGHTATSGSLRVSLFYAHAPSGLASSTSVSIASSINASDVTAGLAYYTGINPGSSPTAFNAASASATGWASGSVTAASGDTIIGGAYADTSTLRTSTPTSPAVERIEFSSATTSGNITLAEKIGVSGTDSVAGTWSGTAVAHIGIGISFAAASGSTAAKALAALGVG